MWDHKRATYHNREIKNAAQSELEQIIRKKKEDLTKKFTSSTKSGTGLDEVCISNWKYFQETNFLQDEIEGDDGVDTKTETSHTAKRRKTKHMEEETKMELWKAALQVLRSPSQDLLNTMCSHLQDPDEQWLLSLAPQLKSLTMQQKSLVRLEIV